MSFRGGVGRLRPGGPVRGTAEQGQHGRQERERGQHGAHDADRADRPQGAVVHEIAGEQDQQPQRHGGRARGDRAERAAHRGERGRGTVVAHGEFLTEARRQQQRVVGGGTDDEDRQDALHLPVDADHVPVGQGVDDGTGQSQSEHRAEDDDEGQQHAAVDEQQDQQHGRQCHAEEQPVDAGERLGQIGLAGRGAGDQRGRVRHAAGRPAHLVQDRGQVVAEVGLQLDDGLQSLPVVGDQRGRRPADDARLPRERTDRAAGTGLLRLGDGFSVGGPDDDGGYGVRPGEVLTLFEYAGGLGAARQEGGLVVRGDLAQLARIGAERAADAQPDQQQDDGDEPPGRARVVLHVIPRVVPICVTHQLSQ
ncbi:hypothetical protein BJ962_006759 [Streptomyces aureorectus]|nr:hypothetical protein [Streptomyces calvus]